MNILDMKFLGDKEKLQKYLEIANKQKQQLGNKYLLAVRVEKKSASH